MGQQRACGMHGVNGHGARREPVACMKQIGKQGAMSRHAWSNR